MNNINGLNTQSNQSNLLRDALYRRFGTEFKSSHIDRGAIEWRSTLFYPWKDNLKDEFESFFNELKIDFNFHMLVDISL